MHDFYLYCLSGNCSDLSACVELRVTCRYLVSGNMEHQSIHCIGLCSDPMDPICFIVPI